jgi:hypothetical protein
MGVWARKEEEEREKEKRLLVCDFTQSHRVMFH